MRSPLGRRLLPATVLLTLALEALVVGSLAAPAGAEPESPASTSTSDSPDAAAAALEEVQELLAPQATPAPAQRQATGDDTEEQTGRDLTLALRELRLRMDDLSAADRAAARRVTKRPSADVYRDFGSARVHWRSTDTAITPRWIKKVGSVVDRVLSTYAKAGYRTPKSDGARGGGDGLLDIYLVDFAAEQQYGLYGYCDTDVAPPAEGPYDTWAYCALDHTFQGFPRKPIQSLKVTAAHELFHAVQFAYDYNEDAWFMEATAVWAEDEVYDRINDNLQYLPMSPMRQPRQSLDQFGDSLRHYGAWIFFRYLSERFPRSQGRMPVIVRKIWERADGSRNGPDDYSIQAVSKELASRGTDLRRVYAQFADANRRPRRTYEEGRSYRAAPTRAHTFTPASHDTGWQQVRVNHLASTTLSVRPGPELKQRRLRVAVDLPAKRRGSAAVLTWYDEQGRAHRTMVRLSRKGVGTAEVRFGSGRVRRVDLTLANASIRSRCWQGQVDGVEYSCRGLPRDDHSRMRYRIRAVR
ncbi:hypothetical protein KM427_06445 [Nocardioides sp. LMS-CY]|uniref:MXAN_6640 family putative metalloprotease n=1 Tax=Nocardioides sp. (strain LMS-CY) TaxID=2840457 RepID=UPI001C007BC0|nr:MXAN_6640 family putative metalloprotease [Nocardioides sp. LMS-CY]QWF23358.1 hypothetical protein KM427_06445 [Nocardioides sp. LMS-CY]